MKRDTVINVLLIIAGIVLAIALFGAGAFWKGKSSPKRSSQHAFDDYYISAALHIKRQESDITLFRDEEQEMPEWVQLRRPRKHSDS